jgi:hypothetical protein
MPFRDLPARLPNLFPECFNELPAVVFTGKYQSSSDDTFVLTATDELL